MKILHISASYYPAFVYGGPTMSITQLCENLAKAGTNITVFTTTANGKSELLVKKNKQQIINGVTVYYFERITKDHTHLSPKLLKQVWLQAKQFDIIHIHAWWNLVSVLSAFICLVKRKKFILSPRGTLSNYSFVNQNSAIKFFMQQTIGRQILNNATFLCTSLNEAKTIEKLFPKAAKFNLPNFVKRLENVNIINKRNIDTQLKIIFLSRIDKKKGIEFLIDALAICKFPFALSIVGDGDEMYLNELKLKINALNIAAHCTWYGHLNDTDKYNQLQENHLLVLPSYNENFANVIIESLSVGTAVLLTAEVGLSDYVVENNLGWIVNQNVHQIANKLLYIYENKNQLIRIAEEAPKIIERDFDENHLTEKYISFYKNLI